MKIVEGPPAWRPRAGNPDPVVLLREDSVLLIYRGSGDELVGIRFVALAVSFGHPNDEALPGHPLSDAGLGFYGIYQVEPSPWLTQVLARNRVVFPSSSFNATHWVITFHDSTFECLATREPEQVADPSAELILEAGADRPYE